jgi:hypothetical protein
VTILKKLTSPDTLSVAGLTIVTLFFLGGMLTPLEAMEEQTASAMTGECDPSPSNPDCAPDFCDSSSGECMDDCNVNPEQCTSRPGGWFCWPSGDCTPIGQ